MCNVTRWILIASIRACFVVVDNPIRTPKSAGKVLLRLPAPEAIQESVGIECGGWSSFSARD